MKLWEFTFADPASAWASAHVAAADRGEACTLLSGRIDRWLNPYDPAGRPQRPAPDVLLRYAGEMGDMASRLIGLTPRVAP